MHIQASVDSLTVLENLRQKVQKDRIRMNNRVSAIEAGRSSQDAEIMAYFQRRFQSIEDELQSMIVDAIQDHEMWPWFKAVKGIGPGLSGQIVASVNIRRAHTISSLWKYAGFGVREDGSRERLTKGEKSPYNAGLKKTLYLVGTSFMRSNSPYRKEYDEAKRYYQSRKPEWTPGHIDMAAKRRMVKLFLSHMWTVWRWESRLPISRPWELEHGTHTTFKAPWDYVEYPYDPKLMEFFGYGVRY